MGASEESGPTTQKWPVDEVGGVIEFTAHFPVLRRQGEKGVEEVNGTAIMVKCTAMSDWEQPWDSSPVVVQGGSWTHVRFVNAGKCNGGDRLELGNKPKTLDECGQFGLAKSRCVAERYFDATGKDGYYKCPCARRGSDMINSPGRIVITSTLLSRILE